jgi:hypothetical protein
MMTLSHSVVGASLGKFTPNPVIAFVVGSVAHIVMDKIPHLWPKKYEHQRVIQIVEWTLGPLLLVLIYYFGKGDPVNMISGALGGAVLDAVAVCIPPVNKGKFGRWHHERQVHSRDPRYIFIDLLVILFFSYVVFFV